MRKTRKAGTYASITCLATVLTTSLHAQQSTAQKTTPPGRDVNVLDEMIDDVQTKKASTADQAFEFNALNADMNKASTSSDATVERARQQVDSANLDAQATKDEAATSANSTMRNESWGSTISDGVIGGVDSGAATLGGAIGGGISASKALKKDD